MSPALCIPALIDENNFDIQREIIKQLLTYLFSITTVLLHKWLKIQTNNFSQKVMTMLTVKLTF